MVTPTGLRIGHAEREAIAASLREHYAQGRLTLDEFNQRLDATFAAKTDADLRRVTADLPHASLHAGMPMGGAPSRALTAAQRSRRHDSGGAYQATRSLVLAVLGVLVIMASIALIASVFIPFALFGLWTPRPLLILVAVLAFSRRLLRKLFGVRGRRPGRR